MEPSYTLYHVELKGFVTDEGSNESHQVTTGLLRIVATHGEAAIKAAETIADQQEFGSYRVVKFEEIGDVDKVVS